MSVSLMTTKKLTKAEKRAEKIEREAQEFAEEQADVLVREFYPLDDPRYAGLSEEDAQKAQEEERVKIKDMTLTMARYRLGERGQIEDAITRELTKRCGNKKLAQELVRMIDCQRQDKKILMDILVKLLQNSEICRGSDVRQQWEGFVEPYLGPELAGLLRALRKQIFQVLKAERLAVEEKRRREVAEQLSVDDARHREAAEQRVAELAERVAILEAERIAGAGAAGSKRPATPSGEEGGSGSSQDDGKRVRGAGAGAGR